MKQKSTIEDLGEDDGVFEYEGFEDIEGELPPKHEYATGPPQQQSLPPPPAYHQPQQQASYSPPPPQTSYAAPPPPPVIYAPPPPPQVSYAPPPPQATYYPKPMNYVQPAPQVSYEPVVPTSQYQPVPLPIPALNYSVPIEIGAPVYQEPVYSPSPASNYQAPPQQQQIYLPPAPPVYSAPPNYSAPVVADTYQQPAPTPVYFVPANNYQPVAPQQTNTYQAPSKPAVSYQQVTYQKPVAQSNYSAPVQPMVRYTPVALLKTNYSSAQPVVVTSYRPVQQYNNQVQQYSPADLAPFISPLGYRANHESLFYYRARPYQTCPKSMYPNGPSYKDIEAAFVYAQAQLGQLRGNGVNYMNPNMPSFAARHQIFSYLSQQNARMDEEGLLVELVSQYLAERACLTKWERQRYLPQLTKLVSTNQFPGTHSCSNYHSNQWQARTHNCYASKYRSIDGFCNNPYHPYWGKSNVCHIRLLSPDYADGISLPRNSYNPRYALPNPRAISNYIHNDIPLDGPYNLMKMQWGQFINHDITNTALSSYEGLVDCCRQPQTRGCWPIYVPPGDPFYGPLNVTCLNFIRSGVCPICQLGPRQQINKNTAFIDLSHVYGNTVEQANQLRAFRGGQLRTSLGRNGEILLPVAQSQEQCFGVCYQAGDSRVNQHPALTALHTLMLRNHNRHAAALAARHPNWNDETLFQEARRINIAEYQMITYNEYLPIVFGPVLSAYYHLVPSRSGHTYYDPKVDPTTWNEYSTATCRFGHSQIQSTFGLYSKLLFYGQHDPKQPSFRLKEWFMRPSLINDGLLVPMINGLLARPSMSVDPWIANDVRNHLYQSHRESSGGDLAATNIWRGRDHGIPGYVHYVEYCFNFKVRGWKDLSIFIPHYTLNQLRRLYKVVENIDLFTGGISERHFPGADIGPTFACVNGIQYYHLKFGDRYYFEHANQAGSFNPVQLDEIKRSTLARLLCRTAQLSHVPQYAFLQASVFNPVLNCSQVGDIDYNKF